jgi:hypothetical protein
MKLEFLDDISNGGQFRDVVADNLVRLYDFTQKETEDLTEMIYQNLIIERSVLDLSKVEFIQKINCRLVLQITSADKGILKTNDPDLFTCSLTEQSYRKLIEIMKAVADGYNWLCDRSDDDIDFLYSAGGVW